MDYSYLILKAEDPLELQREVIQKVKEGWKCIGGPFTYFEDSNMVQGTKSASITYFCQGMEWREEEQQKAPKFPTEESNRMELDKKNTFFQKEENKEYVLSGNTLKIKKGTSNVRKK